MTSNIMKLYGVNISYFTGKLESYLRYKEIPYELLREPPGRQQPHTGAFQMPSIELPDGRWLTDTTPIIKWAEQEYPTHPLLPTDPAQAFLCKLIEDYADEWLWRPAMHYRWSYPGDRHLLSRQIVDQIMGHIRAPASLKRFFIRRRQLGIFVKGDGIDAASWPHADATYLRALDLMSDILMSRPFILGERPTVADIGLMGPMLRHFSHDPTPATIMIDRGPLVWEWVARVWAARGRELSQRPLVSGVPDDLIPLLKEIGETHLEYLSQNAAAWEKGQSRFDANIQGTTYQGARVSRYRVWCLEQLRMGFESLDTASKEATEILIEKTGCWEPLWRYRGPASNYDLEGKAPFGVGLETVTAGKRNILSAD